MSDIGTIGYKYNGSYAKSINDSGQIVGYFDVTQSSSQHAFLYNGSTMTDLGTLGGMWSEAFGINDSGKIVGAAQTADRYWRAFIYNGSTMTDLNTIKPISGWTMDEAHDINDLGQIVGRAYNR